MSLICLALFGVACWQHTHSVWDTVGALAALYVLMPWGPRS